MAQLSVLHKTVQLSNLKQPTALAAKPSCFALDQRNVFRNDLVNRLRAHDTPSLGTWALVKGSTQRRRLSGLLNTART